MHSHLSKTRRGISLIEVMISIGILAIGLTSAVSLIPAGKSEATRALVYDRASALAANALADAATFGLLKPESLFLTGSNIALFDPALNASWGSGTAALKPYGIFANATSSGFTGTAGAIVLRLLAQGRDDVSYTSPMSDDALPTNQFPTSGPRAFQGRMSCLIAVTGTAPLSPGSFATLSAVVFHNRDLGSSGILTVSAFWDGSALSAISVPADKTLRETVRPGTVIYSGSTNTFHQLSMAALDDTNAQVFATFSGTMPSTGNVQILLDSVGFAQQTVTLEGPGPWSQ